MDISKKVSGKKEKQSRRKLWPLIFILAVIPLLMYTIQYDPELGKYVSYNYDTATDDYSLAIKQYALMVTGLIMLVIMVADYVRNEVKINRIRLFLPLGIYLFFAFLSSLFAVSKKYAFMGGYEQFQGFFALLTYGIAIVYAVQYIHDVEDVKYIIKRFLIGVGVMCWIGIMQKTGHDLINYKLYRYLILPINRWKYVDETFGETDLKQWIFLTLYNPNYVGSYVSLILPFTFVLTYVSQKKKDVICCIMLAAGLLLCLYGSGSATGMIGVVVEVLAFIVLLRKALLKRWYFTAPVIFAVIALCFTPFVRNKVSAFMQSMKSTDSSYNLTAIRTNDDNVEIDYKGNTLIISQLLDEEYFHGYAMQDKDYNSINYICDETTGFTTITDEPFAGITIEPVTAFGIFSMKITIDGQKWEFTDQLEGEKSYFYYDPYSTTFDKINVADSIGFKGHETFATGRGYLWSRTLPQLKKSILVGCGPDNFLFKFPNNDYVMKYNVGMLGAMTTKPHNMFLQMAVETGIPSLIAFLVLYLGYFVKSIQLYRKTIEDSQLKKYGVCFFLGTIGYMVTGLANDSMIVVAPVFWTMLGIGIAINLLLQKELKNQSVNEA